MFPFKSVTAALNVMGRNPTLSQQVYFDYAHKDHWGGNACTGL